MRKHDEINGYRKEFVYEQYSRIVIDCKDYDKITKTKMLDAIYDVYRNCDNIFDLCTTRELKYLKLIINASSKHDCFEEKYAWERSVLHDKMLICYAKDNRVLIPEEILPILKKGFSTLDWKLKENVDQFIELLIGYCKIQGESLLNAVVSFGSELTEFTESDVLNFILGNRLFYYYVLPIYRDIKGVGKDIEVAIYRDFYDIIDDLEKQRRVHGLAGTMEIDIKKYQTIFYYDFDIDNPKIKKFLDELNDLLHFPYFVLDAIKDCVMLNADRKHLKQSLKNMPLLQDKDLTQLFEDMDVAMDEMPSGALNGFTRNEAKKIRKEQHQFEVKKEKGYHKQKNACLSKQDAKLFYKLYFALLDFTNQKYKINASLKIYQQQHIDPNELGDVVDQFWQNKDAIILEFCLANPLHLNQKELKLVNGFKKGIRNFFILAKFELEYTAFMTADSVYMVKGVNDNIDNIISYKQLPHPVRTSIVPFKDVLVYDGMLFGLDIDFGGTDFNKIVEKEYKRFPKYYHL